MKFTPLSLKGSFSIDLSPYEDDRGRFTLYCVCVSLLL
jgi:dTDP-4-dehydrorhamnose 3,5-epimerase-like enzyme